MFNIEEQIKKWLGLSSNASNVDEGKEENKTILTSSKTTTQKGKSREEMMDIIKSYYNEINMLNSENPTIKVPDGQDGLSEYEKEIKEDVDEKYKPQELKLKDDLDLKEEKKNDKIESLEEESKKTLNSIDDKYKKLSKEAQGDSIKSGLSRSSILGEKLKDLGLSKYDEYMVNQENLDNKKEDLNKEFDYYKKEYENAINNLNVKKAIEIKNLLEKMRENNGEHYSSIDNDLITKEKNKLYTNIVNEVLNYYSQMPKSEALKEFRSDAELKQLLKEHAKTIENYLRINTGE